MRTSHALILRLWHDPAFNINKTAVEYVDRGAPEDRSTVYGEYIINLDRHYFEIISGEKTKAIPYHRIRRITYIGITIWKKPINPAE
jgi:hypothetical protein